MYRRFEAQIPASVTDPFERERRAEHLLRAYMNGLALKSSKARRSRDNAAPTDRDGAVITRTDTTDVTRDATSG
jgi:hypothetical protein